MILKEASAGSSVAVLSQKIASIFRDATPQQILQYVVPLVAAYPVLVALLRFRNMKRLHRKYNYPTRESFAQMTDEDAFQIQKNLIQFEFPFFYTKSLQFALFKVCPSSSSCCKTTNIIADLWHPYHFADPD